MRRKFSFLMAMILCSAALWAPGALAEPETTPQPTPAPTAAPTQGEDAEDVLSGVMLRTGDSGDHVVLLQMRLRDLGYFTYKVTGEYGSYTAGAVAEFQKQNNLTADGVAGADTLATLYGHEAVRKPVKAVIKPTPTPKKITSSGGGGGSARVGAMKDWYQWVRYRWRRGETCKVIDLNTGKSYNMVFVGGSNHADVEPATKKDCEIFKSTYGGSWSWNRRAVIVNIDGTWVAGSTNGYPHGYETVSGNNMQGQVCIHFLNSRTHGTNVVCPVHQSMIRRAAGKG